LIEAEDYWNWRIWKSIVFSFFENRGIIMSKYLSGPRDFPTKHIKDKKTKGNLKRSEVRFKSAAKSAQEAEMLLTEDAGFLEAEGLERTFKFTQDDIKPMLDSNTQSKAFDLQLPFGPYRIDYTRNGRNLLIGGRKGHVATFNWKTGKMGCELQLRETISDVQWLHNETMFAVAQKKEVFLYDSTGAEIHRLSDHIEVNRLDFLPYHFLLVSIVCNLIFLISRANLVT
jgi:U3 small nucleolar RNA-associated protein 7